MADTQEPTRPLDAVRPAARRAPISGIISAVNYGREKPGVIPLWAGEGDLPTPAFIVEAAEKAMRDGETFYTYQRGHPLLREALAAYHERLYGRPFDPETFYVTGSGMQAIQIAVALTVGEGEDLLMPTPAWPNVSGAATVIGATPVPVAMPETDGRFQLPVERLSEAITPRTRAMFLNSPANPTGWTADRATLQSVLELARTHGLWIIADEIYARFFYGEGHGDRPRAPSFLDVAEPEDRILYVNTFSKNWAMTGWRMGWLHAPVALRQTIENLIQYSTSGVAPFMQRAGIVALNEGDAVVDHMVRRAREGRTIVADALRGHNRVTYAEPDGAFYAFFRVDGLGPSLQAAYRLIDEAGVGTAPGTAFGDASEGFVRICFARSPDSLRDAMARLTRFLAS